MHYHNNNNNNNNSYYREMCSATKYCDIWAVSIKREDCHHC
jgi:hypothetical protein